jgi:hypothetical protein
VGAKVKMRTQPLPAPTLAQVRLLGALQSAGSVPKLPYTEKPVSGRLSAEVKVMLMVWLAPTATLTEPTEAVAETVLSVPETPPPTGAAFGGVTGATGMVPPVPVGWIVPLSLPREVDPQALNIGSDKTPSSSHLWPSSMIPHLKGSVVQIERLVPATPIEALERYAGEG